MIENRHSRGDLAQMQSLPLDLKIKKTRARIKEWYDYWDGNVCVSFSGGKDSTVLKHIVDSMYSDVPSSFVNTGLEYPEIQKFINDIKNGKYPCFNSDVSIRTPSKRFPDVLKEYGYPAISKEISKKIYYAKKGASWAMQYVDGTKSYNGKPSRYCISEKWKPFLEDGAPKISNVCCDIMKKAPIKKYQHETGRKPFLGTLAEESNLRSHAWERTGCNAFDSKDAKSTPLAFWTEFDVLEYIKRFNVPYASVYGDIIETGQVIQRGFEQVAELKTTGVDRTGCMFCMFGCHLEKPGEGRFLRMKNTHPKQYEYCMKPVSEGGLGLKEVIDWMNENCGTRIEC